MHASSRLLPRRLRKTIARTQSVSQQKLMGLQPAASFTLQLQDAQRPPGAGDGEPVPIGSHNAAGGLTSIRFRWLRFPYLYHHGWLGAVRGQKRERSRPGAQSADFVPQGTSWLIPIEEPILFRDLAGIARTFRRLFSARDPACNILGDGVH